MWVIVRDCVDKRCKPIARNRPRSPSASGHDASPGSKDGWEDGPASSSGNLLFFFCSERSERKGASVCKSTAIATRPASRAYFSPWADQMALGRRQHKRARKSKRADARAIDLQPQFTNGILGTTGLAQVGKCIRTAPGQRLCRDLAVSALPSPASSRHRYRVACLEYRRVAVVGDAPLVAGASNKTADAPSGRWLGYARKLFLCTQATCPTVGTMAPHVLCTKCSTHDIARRAQVE